MPCLWCAGDAGPTRGDGQLTGGDDCWPVIKESVNRCEMGRLQTNSERQTLTAVRRVLRRPLDLATYRPGRRTAPASGPAYKAFVVHQASNTCWYILDTHCNRHSAFCSYFCLNWKPSCARGMVYRLHNNDTNLRLHAVHVFFVAETEESPR